MATHKSLQVTFWTRLRDYIKGILLYGSFNWRRASDGLKPPKLSPHERKIATPSRNLEVIKPRENPQAALIKALPKTAPAPKLSDITAGAIVSDPLLPPDEAAVLPKRFHAALPSEQGFVESGEETTSPELDEETVVRRRRRRRHHPGLQGRRAPRTLLQFAEPEKPGLLARLFGTK